MNELQNIVAHHLAKCEETAKELRSMSDQIMTPDSPSKKKLRDQAFAVSWLIEQYRTIEDANVDLEKDFLRIHNIAMGLGGFNYVTAVEMVEAMAAEIRYWRANVDERTWQTWRAATGKEEQAR